jgi:hypothetical protein
MRDIRELFPTDEPVPAERMIGRHEDVEGIASLLESGVSVVLAGARRTGKTSVAQAALERAGQRGAYTAAVDLFRRRDAADLASGIATAVLANRPAAHRLIQRARELASAARDAATLTAAAKLTDELGESVELALTPARASHDPDRALAAALELPERIAVADGKRLVLFLDEFQDLASEGKPFGDPDRITKQMRAIFQRSNHVSFLFAGSVEHLMRDLFGPSDRALSQFGSFRALSPISRDEWAEGLAQRFKALDLTTGRAALDLLLDLADGHPRGTMLIARESAIQSLAGHDRAITEPEVRAGWELAMASDRLRHEQVLERLKRTKHAVRVATRIARGQPPYAGLQAGAGQRAVRALELAGLIERPAPRQWKVGDPLLRRYLADLPGT